MNIYITRWESGEGNGVSAYSSKAERRKDLGRLIQLPEWLRYYGKRTSIRHYPQFGNQKVGRFSWEDSEIHSA